jgi:hypothetical protein
VLADLPKMATIHSNQIKIYNNIFNEGENTYHTYTENYRMYITMIYNQHKSLRNTSVFIRYAVKLEIDFEVEQHRRAGLIFDWKCNTYDNMDFENNTDNFSLFFFLILKHFLFYFINITFNSKRVSNSFGLVSK